MPSKSVRAAAVLLIALLCVGCASSAEPAAPIFGTQDTFCLSVRYYGAASQHLAADSIDCLMDHVEAGESVTVDIVVRTADGSIYRRYAFDGTTTLFVQDSRGDATLSESGLPPLFANRCHTLQRTASFPAASDCVAVDHSGFPEAVAD